MITFAGEPDDIKMFGVKFDLPRSSFPESIDRALLGYRETRGKRLPVEIINTCLGRSSSAPRAFTVAVRQQSAQST